MVSRYDHYLLSVAVEERVCNLGQDVQGIRVLPCKFVIELMQSRLCAINEVSAYNTK